MPEETPFNSPSLPPPPAPGAPQTPVTPVQDQPPHPVTAPSNPFQTTDVQPSQAPFGFGQAFPASAPRGPEPTDGAEQSDSVHQTDTYLGRDVADAGDRRSVPGSAPSPVPSENPPSPTAPSLADALSAIEDVGGRLERLVRGLEAAGIHIAVR